MIRTPSSRRATRPRARALLGGATAIAVVAAVIAALTAPADAVQGEAQRIMYLHVPAAWTAYLCFAIVLVCSVVFLLTYRRRAADIARAAAEAGVLLTVLTLASGMIWGSLTWGTAWVWDGRTTSTVAMGLVYVVYLAARGVETGRRSRIAGAWIGVVGFMSVPVVHFSVLWWRTLHQPATILAPSTDPPLHPAMGAALLLAVVAATLLVAVTVAARVGRLSAVPVESGDALRTRDGSVDLEGAQR